jgi:hypothetical protein
MEVFFVAFTMFAIIMRFSFLMKGLVHCRNLDESAALATVWNIQLAESCAKL